MDICLFVYKNWNPGLEFFHAPDLVYNRNFFGGRSQGYEDEIIQARAEALKELEARAAAMGANAVIGVRVDFDGLGSNGNNMLLVTVTGTAVVVR